jgi:DNA polymerase-3 subunit delta
MIRVFHGDDDFSISEAVRRVRDSVGSADVRDANTSVFEGYPQPEAVLAAAHAAPFLADRRAVIIHGLLTKVQKGDKRLKQQWDAFGEQLRDLPATTELVFADPLPEDKKGKLTPGGRWTRTSGPSAEVREFAQPRQSQLEAWVRERFDRSGGKASDEAVGRMVWLTGGDLRMLDREVAKLVVYCGEKRVEVGDVNDLVPEAREESLFAAVDAILERRVGQALRLMYAVVDSGSEARGLLDQVSRQTRNVIIARDLLDAGASTDRIGEAIGIRAGFALEKTVKQAGMFNAQYLASIHRKLLATDISIKTGNLDDRLAVEILVASIAS